MNKRYRKQIPHKKHNKATGKYVKTKVSIKDLEKLGHRLDGKSCPKCHRKPCYSYIYLTGEKTLNVSVKKTKRIRQPTVKQNQKKIKALQKQLIDFGKNKAEEIKKLQDRVKEQEENYVKFRNYLTKDEITCIKLLYEKGNSIQRIAQIMDRAKCTIADHLKKLNVKKGEKPTLEQVKQLDKNREIDEQWGGTRYTKKTEATPEGKVSPTDGNGNTEPAPEGGVAHLFELKTGRKVNYHSIEDKYIYNRIYARIRDGRLDPVKDEALLIQEETDGERAERISFMHQKGLEVGGAEMINHEEHEKEKTCPYDFENSPFSIVTNKDGKNKGYTDYDIFIRDRNFTRKRYAIEQGQHNPHATPVPNPPPEPEHPVHQENCICPECEEKRAEEARLAQPDPETNGRFTIGGDHIDRKDQVKEDEKPTLLEPKDIVPHGKSKRQLEKMIKRREGIERADVANARAKERLDEEIERLRKKAGESKK